MWSGARRLPTICHRQPLIGQLGGPAVNLKNPSGIADINQAMWKCVGFSLTELMLTISLVAILAVVAIPDFTLMVKNNRQSAYINEFLATLALARSESVKQGVNIAVCKSNNQTNCTPGAGTNWHNGWLVFQDPNNSGQWEAGESILKVHDALKGAGVRFGGTATVANFVRYRPDGTSNQNGTFTLCDDRGAGNAKAVIVSNTGRFRTESAASGGGPFVCPT